MAARDEVQKLVGAMQRDELGLAEGVRRLFEVYRKLPDPDPLRQALAAFAELNERFDLALNGYADMEALTRDIRAAADALAARL